MLGFVGRDRSAETVRDTIIATVSRLPEGLRGTLTWDQGAEMSEHRAFTAATNMDVYFCEPASPWQHGSNENTNGLLRQYFPKGVDLSRLSVEQIEAVADELNSRPRKSLDWQTPTERLAALIDAS
jgi:IS30 family transposase